MSISELLIPSPQEQLVIYMNERDELYVSKISDFGKFSAPVKISNYSFSRLHPKYDTFCCSKAGVAGEYQVMRMGNQNRFDCKADFIDFVVQGSRDL